MLGCASLPLHEAVLPDTAPCNVAPRKDNAVPSISSADTPSSPDDRDATHALPASPGMPAASPLPQLQPDSNFQLADYRSTEDCQQYPALLAGTMFDGAGSSAPYGGITASYSVAVPCYQCALPAFGGAAASFALLGLGALAIAFRRPRKNGGQVNAQTVGPFGCGC